MPSQFPEARPRRLRRNASLRSLFQETEFSLSDLVLPIFLSRKKSTISCRSRACLG